MYEMNDNTNFINDIVLDTMGNISLLAGINIIIIVLKLLFWIFTIVYVYKDSKSKGLDTILWTITTIFVPYHLGFLVYLIISHNNRFYNEVEYNSQNKNTPKSIKIDKRIVKKILVIFVLIIVLVGGSLLTVKMVHKGINSYKKAVNGEVIKTEDSFKSSYSNFNSSEETEIRYHQDGNLKIDYSSKVKKGSLRIGLYKYNGEPVEIFKTNKKSSIVIPIKKNTIYRLIATGENTKGDYEVDWEFEPEE
ncbi:PLD nuclease N-terminal domain-containing protein [Tepidibacter mesophilus]|uniref:PLD nuclease N-terminal domain-containing protein n=1 Tax=Tepidibacter mesophilus TaxID=655607 RepID=UPI000C078113|nr:PLD nuclease N-terminal domain-containing protein [Tepidibacter mesophilus]